MFLRGINIIEGERMEDIIKKVFRAHPSKEK